MVDEAADLKGSPSLNPVLAGSLLVQKIELKGVVDKVFDAAEFFNSHIRTQGGRLPKKIS